MKQHLQLEIVMALCIVFFVAGMILSPFHPSPYNSAITKNITSTTSIAQCSSERPWWDISWIWSRERTRFKVSTVDIRTAVRG